MAQKESILAQRAAARSRKSELKDMRDNNIQSYAASLAEKSVSKTLGASNRALPASKAPKEPKEKTPSRLIQEMAVIDARLNKKSPSDMAKERQEKSDRAAAAREKDATIKREAKSEQQSNRNFQVIVDALKSQSDKMVKALAELTKETKKAKKESSSGGKDEKSLLEKYQEYRANRKKEKAGKSSESRGGESSGGGDEFDIEGHDDRKSKRDQKRQRRIERARSKGKGGKIKGAWNRARGFGENAFSRGESLLDKGDDAFEKVSNSKAGKVAGKGMKVLGHVGGVLSAADALYNAAPKIGTVLDGNEDTATRVGAGAHLMVQGAGAGIGGILGGVNGAAYGAEIGDKVADGAEWLGRKIADNTDLYGAIHDEDGIVKRSGRAISSASDAISNSKAGTAIGMAAAVAMSPFSEDARNALKQDWEQKIIPKMSQTIDPLSEKLGNYTSALGTATSQIMSGVKGAASSAWQGVKDAGNQIADGYKKNGIVGALKAVDGTATKVGQGIAQGGSKLAEGVANAGSTMKYAGEKGTANTVDLAMGFSAKNGFKGMNDSESKAYAANVMKTESGGKLGIVNQYGFAGQYQFGADALADNGLIDKDKLAAAKKAAGSDWYKGGKHAAFMADNANWKNEGGRDEFLKNKQLQDDTFVKYTNKNIEAGYKSGALTANSTPEQIAAYGKAAHLKGTGGANDYFLRGKDSTDANGTKVSDYANGAASSMRSLADKVDAEKAKGTTSLASNKTGADKKYDDLKAQFEAKDAKAKAVGAVDGKTVTLAGGVANGSGTKSEAQAKSLRDAIAASNAETNISTMSVPEGAKSTAFAQTSIPTATAKAEPLPMLNKSVPPEAQTVNVANQPAPAAPANNTVVAGGGGGGNGGTPSLNEMPMYINDMGLVLLNIGHV